MNTLVTVCITTYNRKTLLPLTLKSVLNQTYKNIEIIIVDDYSMDGTQELVENELLKLDNRIKYIRHDKNYGLAMARNTAIKNAKGKYFTFCDDDDEWKPNFIEEFVKVAENYDDNWCFSSGFNYKDSLKNIIYKGFTPPVAGQFYHLSSIKKVNGYNEEIKSGVDHDLWLRLASNDINILGIDKPLAIPNKNQQQDRMTTNYEKRLNGIKNSLEVWQPMIEINFSKNFYKFFRKNYFYYVYKGFLIKSLQIKDFKKSILFFVKLNKILFFRDIIRLLKKRILKKRYPSFFEYKGEK